MIKAAVLGFGTVGSGVVEVIERNNEIISKRVGDDLKVKYVLDLREFPGDPVSEILVHDYNIILEDPEVSIVVETMGGMNPAYEFTKKALLAGKSVCTSNKELVAEHGPELMRIAKEKNVNYLFEASCGGGIPIIRVLNTSLTAEVIEEISGILNGTTNYILTKMAADGSEFEDALKEAQANGYAERNPEADIMGKDACRKIAILSSLAFGKHLSWERIYTEGIADITAADIKYAKSIGCSIKLLATARSMEGGRYSVMVSPVLIGPDNPLYSVNSVFNAVFVRGNMLGDSMFYGSGAGKLPTASAVVGDVVELAKHPNDNVMMEWSEEPMDLIDQGMARSRFFVRVNGTAAGKLPDIQKVFGNVETISIPGFTDEFAFVTQEMSEQEYKEKEAEISGILNMIRARI